MVVKLESEDFCSRILKNGKGICYVVKSVRKSLIGAAAVAAVLVSLGQGAEEVWAQDKVLNLYTARHYQTDEALYENFTKKTGIKVNRIEGKGDQLLQRVLSEGENSPADVLLTVDVGNLWRAQNAGVFQAVDSEILDQKIPENLRHPDGYWYSFSSRARLIYYDKAKVEPGEITSYEELADPKWKGRICIRESSNIYNQSLLGSLIAAHDEAWAEDWASKVVANFARQPVKGDTNQLRGIGTGECEVAVANSYYFVRLMTRPKAADEGLADKIGVVFPNQDGRGTHINVSGGGVLKHAPNRESAIKFLEYLVSAEAQTYFAQGNNEYPVVNGVAPDSALGSLGTFKADDANISVFGQNQAAAQKIFDRVGWR
jgi:iron(III) transport system substrate-binding protein